MLKTGLITLGLLFTTALINGTAVTQDMRQNGAWFDGMCEIEDPTDAEYLELADCDVSVQGDSLVMEYDNEGYSRSILLRDISNIRTQTYTLSRHFGGRGERRRTGIAIDHTDQGRFQVLIVEMRSRNAFKLENLLRENVPVLRDPWYPPRR